MAISTRRTVTSVVLALAAVIWVLVNGSVEGRVLLVLTPDHGLTQADLLSVAAVVVGAVLLLTGRRPKAEAAPVGPQR